MTLCYSSVRSAPSREPGRRSRSTERLRIRPGSPAGGFLPMAGAMVKPTGAMVKPAGAMVNCRNPALSDRATKSLVSSAGSGSPPAKIRPFPAWNRQFRPACSDLRVPRRSLEKKEQRFPGTPVSGPEITREPWSNRPEPWSIGGAMVKPAEQWSIRTRAERAIESGLDGALTQVIAKLPRGLVAELTGQLAGQRIADPPAWASTSALGPLHAPRSGYSSPRMAFN